MDVFGGASYTTTPHQCIVRQKFGIGAEIIRQLETAAVRAVEYSLSVWRGPFEFVTVLRMVLLL